MTTFKMLEWVVADDDQQLLDDAAAWGHEDATEGVGRRGEEFYALGSALASYNQGYDDGLALLATLSEGALDELAWMDSVLNDLRGGKVTAQRISEELLDEIEGEWIGRELCEEGGRF